MIELRTTIHDQYSIELKMGFVTDGSPQENDFTVGMWIFVPESLDITPASFTKKEFYRCVKSNIRLKTPHFKLSEIVGGDAVPLKNVIEAPEGEYDYCIKLFCAIVNSALRESLEEISACEGAKKKAMGEEFISHSQKILDSFFALPVNRLHSYCGEFLCNKLAGGAFSLISLGCCEAEAKSLVRKIYDIRTQKGYPTIDPASKDKNRSYLHRHSVLKKMVEGELYLRAPKKKDGVLAEQVHYSIAAGLAMIFATVVAWAFQRTFGNLTWPLFLALIISYMMKDRIKELMRYYFAYKISDRYYDNKARISIHGRKIGWLKEAMDFIPSENVPSEINVHRNAVHLFEAETGNIRENVILYRKSVKLDSKKMEQDPVYDFEGINDIIRIQVRPFLRKMDNPTKEVWSIDSADNVISVQCDRDYFINIVMKYQSGNISELKRFRITLSRDGVKKIEAVD
ncbi:MAG: hypothetical protein HUJ93_06270 [Bacteroidales bacterium]|nr:hypothetical protein [Bacteroidales bacterium]